MLSLTFTLTAGVDTVPGLVGSGGTTNNAGNDTFVGQISATASSNTFNLLDNLSGGDGTDTLSLAALDYADNDALTVATVSGIETLTLRAADATAIDDILVTATNFKGLTTFNNDRSTSNVQIASMASGTTVNVIGNGALTNADTAAAYSSSVTTGTLNLQSGVTAGAIALNGAGLTTISIGSTGATNVAGAISTNSTVVAGVTINAATALTTTGLTIANNSAGTATLTISGAAADRSATASAAPTAAVVLGAADADFKSIDASGLTVGGVSLTLSSTTTATFKGGAGNDVVTTSTNAQTGSVDAGTGSDTLVLTATAHIDSAAEGALYKGFDTLRVDSTNANVVIDMDTITGSTITAIQIADAANTTSITDMNATQAAAVQILASAGAMTLGIKNATDVGTIDTLKITVSDGDTTSAETVAGTADWTISGVETIEITATDDLTIAGMTNISGLSTLKVSGAGDVSVTTAALGLGSNFGVNFSGLTKSSIFDFSAATANALSFTGGSAVDTVSTSVVGGNILSLGTGNDVVTMQAVTGGTSATKITGGAGADAIDVATHEGNDAGDAITFIYADGDSVSISGGTLNLDTNNITDSINNISSNEAAGATAGNLITWDTAQSATAVTFSTTNVTLGTTTVTNAFDFYVFDNNAGTSGSAVIYQDTDGDKVIEAGEFAVYIVGAAQFTTGEFTVSSGNLVLTTAA